MTTKKKKPSIYPSYNNNIYSFYFSFSFPIIWAPAIWKKNDSSVHSNQLIRIQSSSMECSLTFSRSWCVWQHMYYHVECRAGQWLDLFSGTLIHVLWQEALLIWLFPLIIHILREVSILLLEPNESSEMRTAESSLLEQEICQEEGTGSMDIGTWESPQNLKMLLGSRSS